MEYPTNHLNVFSQYMHIQLRAKCVCQENIRDKQDIPYSGLSLIFQVDGELKKVAGGQKKSGATAVGCY